MKKATVYRIYNAGQIKKVPSGWRSFVVFATGRKYIHICDWTNLKMAVIDVRTWQALHPQAQEVSATAIMNCIRRMLRVIKKTGKIKAVIKVVEGKI